MALGPDVPEHMCSQLVRPPRHLSVASGPSDASHTRCEETGLTGKGTKVTRSPRLLCCHGRLALRALASPSTTGTTHATASDSTCRKPIRQVMARHVPPAPTHRERRPCASCHHAGPRLVAGLGRRLDSADMGCTCIPRHCSLTPAQAEGRETERRAQCRMYALGESFAVSSAV